MPPIAKILVALVALEHIGFLVMEMFAWTTPGVRKIFGISAEFATASRALAANQGLYNGFLAAGLIWSAVHPDLIFARPIAVFFLACVLVAAVYGGVTVKRSIMLVQGLPALIALVVVLLS